MTAFATDHPAQVGDFRRAERDGMAFRIVSMGMWALFSSFSLFHFCLFHDRSERTRGGKKGKGIREKERKKDPRWKKHGSVPAVGKY